MLLINDFEFIPIFAQEKKIGDLVIKPKNLDILLEKYLDIAQSAVNSSSYQGLIEDIKNKIRIIINDLRTEINVDIVLEIKKLE